MTADDNLRDSYERGIDYLLAEISLNNDAKVEGGLWQHISDARSKIAEIDSRSSHPPPLPSPLLSSHRPEILITAIVEEIAKHKDGSSIRVLQPAWDTIVRWLRTDPHVLPGLTPRQWEELIASSYEKAGYDEVILTPRSGDLGRDIIARKEGWGSIRIIDQVKAYNPGHLVTANDVRALLGVLHADTKATKGIVTTTSGFAPMIYTDPFISPSIPYRLELVNGLQLLERLRSLAGISTKS